MQSQLRRRLLKAAPELVLPYFYIALMRLWWWKG